MKMQLESEKNFGFLKNIVTNKKQCDKIYSAKAFVSPLSIFSDI